MVEQMTFKSTPLHDELKFILEKSSYFTKRQMDAFWHIIRCLIGSSSFSLKKVIKRIKSKFSRNFLALVLKKFAYVQEKIFKLLFEKITKNITLRDKISFILDDTLVKKRGKKIFGSLIWYDHSSGHVTQSMCLVNIGITINGELIIVLPFLLRTENLEKSKSQSKYKSQDPKTIAGMELISQCILYLEEFNISKNQVLILVDSWFCTKAFKEFLIEHELNFRMDSRYNLNVQQPDIKAINDRKIIKRGRKRKKWIKYTGLKDYFESIHKIFSFKEKKHGDSIKAKRANITLKTHGRVLIYAFYSNKYQNPKFIMTRCQTKSPPSPKTIYHEYLIRWEIETAHRELKQQFGIGKSQNRDSWVVMGFIGFINFSYSLFKYLSSKLNKTSKIKIKCPSWAEEFHMKQIIDDYTSTT